VCGRPKAAHSIQELARKHTAAAIETLAAIMRSPEAAIMRSPEAPYASRVAAAAVLLKKTLPDLAAMEHKGDVAQSFVIRVPEVAPTVEAWQATLIDLKKNGR